jgi:hypothetical protein
VILPRQLIHEKEKPDVIKDRLNPKNRIMISTIPNVQHYLIIHKKGGSRDDLANAMVVSALGHLDVVD